MNAPAATPPAAPVPVTATVPDIAAFAGLWREGWVAVRVRGHGAAAADPAVANAVRGAIGWRLMEGASAEARREEPCPWQPPCTLDWLFRDQARMAGDGRPVPKPVMIAVDAVDGDLLVRISLAGAAAERLHEVQAALVAGLRGGLSRPGMADGLDVIGRYMGWSDLDRIPLPAICQAPDRLVSVALDLLTPLALRRGGAMVQDPQGLLGALAGRINGLALWHGVAIDEPHDSVRSRSAGAIWDASDCRMHTWQRRAGKDQRPAVAMAGLIGRLVIHQVPAALLPVLVVGQATHAGSHAALGLGRYRLMIDDR
ncbi:CRISPR system precrRNA processing endoribonuclease RAMP protein Cas6 [Tistrella sp. BH-R2-4]|uniref:CRISPR system precrRNA processing endoribonuclease RAMP protein Cas6 n=1 Tax=Tistrella arctica TaxID=3133430 RepID=A0ABU9YNB5_9PROT